MTSTSSALCSAARSASCSIPEPEKVSPARTGGHAAAPLRREPMSRGASSARRSLDAPVLSGRGAARRQQRRIRQVRDELLVVPGLGDDLQPGGVPGLLQLRRCQQGADNCGACSAQRTAEEGLLPALLGASRPRASARPRTPRSRPTWGRATTSSCSSPTSTDVASATSRHAPLLHCRSARRGRRVWNGSQLQLFTVAPRLPLRPLRSANGPDSREPVA